MAERLRRPFAAVLAAAAALAVVVAVLVWWILPSRLFPWDSASFPEIDTTALSPTQVRIVELLEQQHEAQHPGTYYSEGVREPWCADFVSWIMREAGVPLANPHSGHWRIPGVYTLQEYYEQVGRHEPAGSGYRPAIGDVVLYHNRMGLGQREHTNIVVAVDGDSAITVGGNEMGRIRVHELDLSGDDAVVGFGRLPG
ncbi:CHAP domain-containing protein [Rhodococcus sp. CH91]|uniref:CHAP domain-containing protein n=1 Tax=Rhodococcus sp. CH91 TaxID=2910256 RepID=UPI001F4B3C5C|nr:CHAP domain-containing protein [Rhodococcus sp. CH91]